MEAGNQEGHRKRLQEKFGRSRLEAFLDYEIVELLLTLGTYRKDCKPQAKKAIEEFKTLRGVLEAPPEELQRIKGISAYNTFVIKFVQDLAEELLKERVLDKPYCKSSKEVYDYLCLSMRHLRKETFKVIFLNAQNQVLAVEDLFEGTLTASAVYPREVMKKAIEHKAASVIFAHNHPSGNPEPSENDRQITRDLILAARTMQVEVLDHIVVGENRDRYFSFADKGLIEEYKAGFASRGKGKGAR